MSDFEDIQRLIRLKRHERPPQEFVEEFVSTFQERQRSELLQRSARGLLWERVMTYFDGLLNPKWAWAGATAAAFVGAGLVLRPAAESVSQVAQNKPASATISVSNYQTASLTAQKEAASLNADVHQYLVSHHYGGGLGDEQVGDLPPDKYKYIGFNLDLTDPAGTRR